MADLASLTASVENLKAQNEAEKQKEANKPATVLQSDLDPLKSEIDQVASDMQQRANAP